MLKIEFTRDGQDHQLPSLAPGATLGSLEDVGTDSILVFECYPDDTGAIIYRSLKGATLVSQRHRIIFDDERKDVAEIPRGGQAQAVITHKNLGQINLRFTHVPSN